MISPKLHEKARELRGLIEGLTCEDVLALRDAGGGRPHPSNPLVRKVWSPGQAWSARVELGRLRREIDLLLLHCSGE